MSPILGIWASQNYVRIAPSSYESIQTVTVGSPVSSISFSSIPSTYKHLQIRGISKNSTAAGGGVSVTVNGDTGANYSWHRLYGDGTSASAYGENNSSIFVQLNQTISTATPFGVSVLDILDYADTNKNKTIRVLHGWDNNGSGNAILSSGNWRSTSAITSITLTPNASFVQYSSFALYGIKG